MLPVIPIIVGSLIVTGIVKAFIAAGKPSTFTPEPPPPPEIDEHEEAMLRDPNASWKRIMDNPN